MQNSNSHIQNRTALASFVFVTSAMAIIGTTAQAGVIVGLLPNPSSTAGVPTSTRSGVGTWQLYAIEDAASTDLGIAAYNITMTGTTAINHRSPSGTAIDSNGDVQDWGFRLLRSGTNMNPIVASEPLSGFTPFVITGLGISAGNATSQILASDADATGITTFSVATWGTYNSSALQPQQNLTGHKWVFLAEGLGAAPAVTSAQFTVLTSAQGTQAVTAAQIQTIPQCLCGISVIGGSINNVNGNNPGFVDFTFTAFTDLPSGGPLTWSGLNFGGYFPAPAAPGPPGSGPAILPTLDPVTHKFHWNTVGSPIGQYRWFVSASAQGYTDQGILDVYITAVPEPATLSLLGLALVGGLSFVRRRRA